MEIEDELGRVRSTGAHLLAKARAGPGSWEDTRADHQRSTRLVRADWDLTSIVAHKRDRLVGDRLHGHCPLRIRYLRGVMWTTTVGRIEHAIACLLPHA